MAVVFAEKVVEVLEKRMNQDEGLQLRKNACSLQSEARACLSSLHFALITWRIFQAFRASAARPALLVFLDRFFQFLATGDQLFKQILVRVFRHRQIDFHGLFQIIVLKLPVYRVYGLADIIQAI